MAKHYVITFKATDGHPAEDIRVKAPNEAAALARLRQALRDAGHDDARSTIGLPREAIERLPGT